MNKLITLCFVLLSYASSAKASDSVTPMDIEHTDFYYLTGSETSAQLLDELRRNINSNDERRAQANYFMDDIQYLGE